MSTFTPKLRSYQFTGDWKSMRVSAGYTLVWDQVDPIPPATPSIGDVRSWMSANGMGVNDLVAVSATEDVLIKSRTVSMIEGSEGELWDVSLECDNNISFDPATFTAISYNIETTISERWRVWTSDALCPLSVPAAPASTPTEDDIGGQGVDVGGEPVSWILPTMTIQVTNYTTAAPNFDFYADYVAKRNDDTFLGVGAGKLLFRGVQVTRTGADRWEMVFDFAADPAYHLRQLARKSPDGNVMTYNNTMGPFTACQSLKIEKAAEVYWRQPFPETSDFEGMGIVTS